MIYFLIFMPVIGMLPGVLFRSIAAARDWQLAHSGPYQRFLFIACFVGWLIGPFLWPDFGLPLVLSLLGPDFVDQYRDNPRMGLEIVFGLSALPFVLLGGVIGWCLGPEKSSIRDYKRRMTALESPPFEDEQQL